MSTSDGKLAAVAVSERVLLISHCLRPSQTCPGKFDKLGLVCPETCAEDCVVGRLRKLALSLGYKGVCVAAGGKMALRYVAEQHPRGIVAVACVKELQEGVEGVEAMDGNGAGDTTITAVPLTKDGCVDTEVDESSVVRALRLGCDGRLPEPTLAKRA